MNLAVDDCFIHDRDRLRHDEALRIIRERIEPAVGTEIVPLAQALGRVLAGDVRAPRPIPAHTNAAVDGYAYAHRDVRDEPMRISTRILAGDAPLPLESGTAARIMTGAALPAGADTVAMQEDCVPTDSVVRLPSLKPGANVRSAGEDVAANGVVARSGARLSPPLLATIASTGTGLVSVRNRLRIALFSTGTELLAPGSEFREGAVYDSNSVMLQTLVADARFDVTVLPTLADRAGDVRRALAQAAEAHDAVVTSGGASKGEEDHILAALDTLGKRHLWQLAVKPGRPMLMGQIGPVPVIGVPGNPVAALVCGLLYLRPLLDRLAGAEWREPMRYAAPAAFDLRSKPDRREFLRGWIETREGVPHAVKYARDGSGLISGLVAATGLIEIPEETERVAFGQAVAFLPFAELGMTT